MVFSIVFLGFLHPVFWITRAFFQIVAVLVLGFYVGFLHRVFWLAYPTSSMMMDFLVFRAYQACPACWAPHIDFIAFLLLLRKQIWCFPLLVAGLVLSF